MFRDNFAIISILPTVFDQPYYVIKNAVDGNKKSNFYSSFSFLLLVRAPTRTVDCLCFLHRLIVVSRDQTGPSSTYSLTIHNGP